MTGRSPEFHGKDGDWVMEEVRYQNPLSKRFLEVGSAAGLGTNDDFNDWSRPQDGVGRFQVSESRGERCSGATAFLAKAMKRKNLKVRTGTMVRKIDFDTKKTAVGVTYDLMGDDTCRVSCFHLFFNGTRKFLILIILSMFSIQKFEAKLAPGGEVLVCNGAIGSPQLLMCSGIGPSKHLKKHGIPVVHDNSNVGENLQDHPAAVVSFKTPVKGVSVTSKLRLLGTGLTNPFPVLRWLLFKTGLLTSTGCDHGAFVRTAASTGQPDLQIRFLAARALGPDGMTTFTQFRNTKNLVSIDVVLPPSLVIENIRAHVVFLCFSRMMDTRSRALHAVPRVKAACVLSLPMLTLGQQSMEDTSPTLPTSQLFGKELNLDDSSEGDRSGESTSGRRFTLDQVSRLMLKSTSTSRILFTLLMRLREPAKWEQEKTLS